MLPLMPRKSKLHRCVSCKKHRAKIGVLTNYYVLGSRRSSSSRTAKKQIAGSLPARGYCVNCFLELAKTQGLHSEQRHALRKKLKPHKHATSHHTS
jgi:hypothetical protein